MICVQTLFRRAWEVAHRLLCNRPVIAAFYKVIFRESLLQVPDHFLSERFLLFLYEILKHPCSGNVCRTGAIFSLWKTEVLLVARAVLLTHT